MDSQPASQIASIGLAVRACTPSLLHAIRGSLHDLSLLATLMQPAEAPGAGDDSAAAKTWRRVGAIQAQLKILERHIALLEGVLAWPKGAADAVCATAPAVADVVRLLNYETVRRRIKLEHDIAALPAQVLADERALQQALLMCGTWMAQQLPERATLRFSGYDDGEGTVFEFEANPAATDSGSASKDEQALLATLVATAGGKLVAGPPLRIVFGQVPERIASSR